jgi:chitodextrinase
MVGVPGQRGLFVNPAKLGASSGTQVAWKWDFGDGGTSTSKSGVHRYTREGYWTVKLRVTYSDGSTRSFSYSIHTWID